MLDHDKVKAQPKTIKHTTIRALTLLKRLEQGKKINRKDFAEEFKVDPRTIQRDIRNLRMCLSDSCIEGISQEIIYDGKKNTYVLENAHCSTWIANQEIVAISKVLLESRAFCKNELENLLNKLLLQSIPEERKIIKEILSNERFHYVELQHKQPLIEKIWQLSKAVQEQQVVKLLYLKMDTEIPAKRIIEPQGILFSEYYFYLIAYDQGVERDYPRIFRLDRIKECTILTQKFKSLYSQRFEEGEFRKRVQFMLSGQLIKVQFRFWGNSLEAVLDRFPNAKKLSENENGTVIEAEVFGLGVKMWLLSQGQNLEVLEPKNFRNEMEATIVDMMKIY